MLTAPDAPHTLDGKEDFQAIFQIMPETEAGSALRTRYLSDASYLILAADRLGDLLPHLQALRRSHPEGETVRTLVQEVANRLLSGAYRLGYDPAVDPRVRQALQLIEELEVKTASMPEIAEAVHLSPSRFRHLFKAETGVDFRNYLMQRRLVAFVKEISADPTRTLTEAAHATGFSDGSHLNRVFKRIVGLSPSVTKRMLPYFDVWFSE